jgi:hypothetical protein
MQADGLDHSAAIELLAEFEIGSGDAGSSGRGHLHHAESLKKVLN